MAEYSSPKMLILVEPVTLSVSMEKGIFPEVIKAVNLKMERIFWATQADSTSSPRSFRAERVSQLQSEGAVTMEEEASERCCEDGWWDHESWRVGSLWKLEQAAFPFWRK